MKWIMSNHADRRKIERVGDKRIRLKKTISEYKNRYLDREKVWHLMDLELGIEIIGEEKYGKFHVFTVFDQSLDEFNNRRNMFETNRYSRQFKFNKKIKLKNKING